MTALPAPLTTATGPGEAPSIAPRHPTACLPITSSAVALLALFLAAIILPPVPVTAAPAPDRASSLDQVPSRLRTPEARTTFREQMDGRPAPDRFNTALPPELPADVLEALLRTPGDTAPRNTLGARPIAGFPNLFAALLCTGGERPQRPGDPGCTGARKDPPLRTTLALVQARPGAAPRLVAPAIPFDGVLDWRDSGLPSDPDDLDSAADGRIRPDALAGFDPAAFRLAPGEPAFGLRASWGSSYSGGLSRYEALYLFALVDGTLRQVFAAPMSAYRDTAGDWHPDGTRAHEVSDGAHVLVVSGRGTASHADLLLRDRTGPWRQLFRWNPGKAAYGFAANQP